MIRRRHVFHLAGYDPIEARKQHRSFGRQTDAFAKTWNVTAAVSNLQRSADGSSAGWTVETTGLNWRVETVYEPMLWDDIVLADMAGPMTTRLARSAVAFAGFVKSRTASRYFQANWKYGLFFLFPYFYVCVFAAIAFAMGRWMAGSFGLAGMEWLAVHAMTSAATFLGLLQWPGRRWRVLQALDDWIFSSDYVHGRRPDLDARLDRFADRLIERAQNTSLDEIVISGHSMGATLAVEVVARALARDPMFGRRGPAVCLLTVGSTIPKFTLHPAGARIRDAAQAIADEPAVAWAEYHARNDVISFYKFDPVTASRVCGDRTTSKPMIRRVQLDEMLEAKTFRHNYLKFMRLHYQFVMANERRSPYDYFMMICGPVPFLRSVLAPGGATELIGPDGTLAAEVPLPQPIAA